MLVFGAWKGRGVVGWWESGSFGETEECFTFCFCHEVVDHGNESVFQSWDWGFCSREGYAVDCYGSGWVAEEARWDLKSVIARALP